MKLALETEWAVITMRIWQIISETRSLNTEEGDWWVKTAEWKKPGDGSEADDWTEETEETSEEVTEPRQDRKTP